MVYQTGESPSYAKPTCDLCDQRLAPEETALAVRFTVSKPFPDSRGTSEHRGHICPSCNDVDESLGMPSHDSISMLRFHVVIDEERRPQLLSLEIHAKHGTQWRMSPGDLPERLESITGQFYDQEPGIEPAVE